MIGGSIGGLTTALLLRRLGFDVSVFERTPTNLDGRGGGIVCSPTRCAGSSSAATSTPNRSVPRRTTCSISARSTPIVHPRANAPWSHTSWGTFYRALLPDFGIEDYHLGEYAAGFDEDADGVEVRCSPRVAGTRRASWCSPTESARPAGGSISPDTRAVLEIVGWRGTVPEREVSPETFELLQRLDHLQRGSHTHTTVYPIPSTDGGLAVPGSGC